MKNFAYGGLFVAGLTCMTIAAGCGTAGDVDIEAGPETTVAPVESTLASTTTGAPETVTIAPESTGTIANYAGQAATANQIGMALGDSLIGLKAPETNQVLAEVQGFGLGHFRLDFDGSVIVPNGPTDYNWTQHDRIMGAASEHGMGVKPVFAYTGKSMRDKNCGAEDKTKCPPADNDQYADFIVAALDRYPSLRDKPTSMIELWNEQNNPNFWEGPDAARYAELYKAVVAKVHAKYPNVHVMVGGLSPMEGNLAPAAFLAAIYDAGVVNIDGLDIHPYTFPATPDQQFIWSSFNQIEGGGPIPVSASVWGVMDAHGDGAKPIGASELGAPTRGKPGHMGTLANQKIEDNTDGKYVDEALQAEIFRQYLSHVFVRANVVDREIYHLRDKAAPNDGDAATDPEYGYGILNFDGSPKLAAGVVKSYVDTHLVG